MSHSGDYTARREMSIKFQNIERLPDVTHSTRQLYYSDDIGLSFQVLGCPQKTKLQKTRLFAGLGLNQSLFLLREGRRLAAFTSLNDG